MSEYYAVQRTTDHLAHYGVKGMRWGVRKAIETGNAKRLAKNFTKAQRKLAKLTQKTDIDKQKELAKKHGRRAVLAVGVSATAIGLNYKNNIKKRSKTTARKKRILGEGKGIKKVGNGLVAEYLGSDKPLQAPSVYYQHPAFKPNTTNSSVVNNAAATKTGRKSISTLGAIGLTGLGVAAYQTGKAISAKRATTQKGHAKAVAKRDAWEKEMRATFKGTKYANRIGAISNQNKKKRR